MLFRSRSARRAREAILKLVTALIAEDADATCRMEAVGLSPAKAAEVIHAAAGGQSKAGRSLSLEMLEARVLAVVRLCLGPPSERICAEKP